MVLSGVVFQGISLVNPEEKRGPEAFLKIDGLARIHKMPSGVTSAIIE
jgi:hypothetical protein